MNIFITGSAGFIGSHLVEKLLKNNHQVIGFDNYSSGQRKNTDLFANHANFSFIESDISKAIPQVNVALDWVMHFASLTSPPHYQQHPIETLMAGAQGTQHCLELAKEHQAKFMLASTSEVYGEPKVHPQPEGYWGNVNPNGLRSCYNEAKRYAEAIVMAYHRYYGLDTRIVRIFNTYGPRMRVDDGRVVTNFINQALRGKSLTVYGDGKQTRSFQYIDDLIEGIICLMTKEYVEPINLGNPDEYTILHLARIIRDKIAPNLQIIHKPLPKDDPTQRCPDISKAKDLLGWQPKVHLGQGLEQTIRYFREVAEVTVLRLNQR